MDLNGYIQYIYIYKYIYSGAAASTVTTQHTAKVDNTQNTKPFGGNKAKQIHENDDVNSS